LPQGEEPDRRCTNCRAIRNPAFGSAWCGLVELGERRARICANFVPFRLEEARLDVTGGRSRVIEIWNAVSEELRLTLGENNHRMWFAEVEPLALQENRLLLSVRDELVRDWHQKRWQPSIRAALAKSGYPDLEPAYVVEQTEAPTATPESDATRTRDLKQQAGFNPHYSFGEFIVGSGNRLAHASALACVDKPGEAYNPLVLYGGVGVGKTHLLQAIGQEAIEQGRGYVLYATSETFTNELIHAIREGSTGAFRERYRSVDYLLLDDIQFIAGKEATQEEFFHTFNALHQSGKQIVLTCDRPPQELRVLEDRLRSRFAWGLLADMQPPDLETRIAIVRSKASLRCRRLPETVLNLLATRAGKNVRELEGALNRILARADMLGTEPGMEIARTVLGEPDALGGCSAGDVMQAVSAYYRVKTSELSGPVRERGIAYARQMAMYLMREEAKLSLIEVGNHLGGRNHSTVIYGHDKIAAEVKRKGRVKQDLQALRQLIYG
jgi:chromosomal replication initiator protein